MGVFCVCVCVLRTQNDTELNQLKWNRSTFTDSDAMRFLCFLSYPALNNNVHHSKLSASNRNPLHSQRQRIAAHHRHSKCVCVWCASFLFFYCISIQMQPMIERSGGKWVRFRCVFCACVYTVGRGKGCNTRVAPGATNRKGAYSFPVLCYAFRVCVCVFFPFLLQLFKVGSIFFYNIVVSVLFYYTHTHTHNWI